MCIAIFRAFHGLHQLVCLFIYLLNIANIILLARCILDRASVGLPLSLCLSLLYEVDPWIGGGVLRGQVDSNHCAI